MEDQLAEYREAQRRKHDRAVDSQGSVSQSAQPGAQQNVGVSSSTTSSLYPQIPQVSSTPVTPSAPPAEDEPMTNLYPDLSELRSPSSPQDSGIAKVRQFEEDERLAQKIQEQEREEQARIQQQQSTQRNLSDSQMSDDEELAHRLQEEEEAEVAAVRNNSSYPGTYNHAPSTPNPLSSTAPSAPPAEEPFNQEHDQPQQEQQEGGGWLATIGRGLRGVYDMYQTYSQQAADYAAQQAAQQVSQQQHQQQIHQDEELARRLQAEEAGTARTGPIFQVHPPTVRHRGNYPHYYNYDEDLDEEDPEELFPTNPHEQNPLSRLREVNSMFRSMGAPPEHPLLQHLQMMMQQSNLQRGGNGGVRIVLGPGASAQRYRFPRPVFQHMRGIETLPPELLGMMEGEQDSSYESLLALADRMQPVSRGASTQQIDQLPTKTYTEGSMPEDQKSCGVCLSDYENGEQLRTLPGCFHSFHKDCIDKWLQINKVCPVCRHEITETGENAQ